MKRIMFWTGALLVAGPVHAQAVIDPHDVIGAAIASDIVQDRQAQRDARRAPYLPTSYGPIDSADAASRACAAKAGAQAGPGAMLLGPARARSMSTGWEVEGVVGWKNGGERVPFVCSVRNGSVSGILLRR
ncbi:hypothetical protein J3E64_002272 [Sphingobium sp. OAS761]|uniref:hypothetical protein n=1 Tax=Sphingobium sp. OAS761 TaxID=2817901 RepID=UPI00209EA875|nr:hypothetical protein [Sphingobium sp. OAS761]MCP1470584.1 hypothetical protein [Sphingobium sp. OAS761]